MLIETFEFIFFIFGQDAWPEPLIPTEGLLLISAVRAGANTYLTSGRIQHE